MKKFKVVLVLLLAMIMFSGSWYGKGNDDDRRDKRVKDSKEILELLYEEEPKTKEAIKSAYGYATFKSLSMTMMVFAAEGGSGIAYNNVESKVTYMNMASAGMGMGMGIKDVRIVFLFENKKVYDNFISNGWEAHAQVDAAAKDNDSGEALNEAITVEDGVKIYKLTKRGLAMQMTIQGTKYFKAKDLN